MLGGEIETGQSILAFALQQISHTGIFSGQVDYQQLQAFKGGMLIDSHKNIIQAALDPGLAPVHDLVQYVLLEVRLAALPLGAVKVLFDGHYQPTVSVADDQEDTQPRWMRLSKKSDHVVWFSVLHTWIPRRSRLPWALTPWAMSTPLLSTLWSRRIFS